MLLFLTGCGYVSAPLPPALDVPLRVTDLRVTETGENIEVSFTLPPQTTEGLALKNVKQVELRAVTNDVPSVFEVPATAPGAITHHVPAKEWIGKDATFTVRATGPKGKMSEWSNAVAFHVDQPLTKPENFKAENVARGVRLSWNGSATRYRIFRAVGDQPSERIGESDAPEYVDEMTQYGMRYQYSVRAISGDYQQSELSEIAAITPDDKFPPGVPAGLTVVADVSAIELAWTRNTEPDFQGYNVYRSVEGGPMQKIASLIPAPAYSDRMIESGKKYRYAVSAVDAIGNESAQCPPQDVTAQ